MRRLVSLLILGPLVVLLPAAEGPGRLLSAGQQALLRNDFDKAAELGKRVLALAREAVKKEPKDISAWLLLEVHWLGGLAPSAKDCAYAQRP